MVVYMLPDKMKNNKVVTIGQRFSAATAVNGNTSRLMEFVIIRQKTIVITVQALVARCKEKLAKLRIIQKKATREIVYSLFGLGKKLIGKEGYIIARLLKQFWEQRIIAPFAFLTNNVHGQNVLKDKACQVPTRHHITELSQQSAPFEL